MNPAQLANFAAAIADGTPIDWNRPEFHPLNLPADVVARIRIVERIAQVHASLPPRESFSASLHKSLIGVCLPGDCEDAGETPITWGPLTIDAHIGRGTFGDVYKARDPRLNRPVALKLLRRKDRFASAVIEEGHLMARVRHPNVVTVFGAERIDGRVGLWMEFLEGQTLEQELKSQGRFPADEVRRVGLDLCRALAAVHRANLLHRDLKAENVMREADGRIVVTDFGAGRELSDTSDAGAGYELAGTPLYLAPEVLAGRPASTTSDVYSLGVLLYRLATGSFPVRGRSLNDLRAAHTAEKRVPLKDKRPDLPKALAAAIERATHPDPSQRFASAAEMEAALHLSASASPLHRHNVWVATALVTLTAIVYAAVRWNQPSPAEQLSFRPRDLVLVTRFENRTGDSVFDGALEYALERELGNSDAVGLVPRERVEDALVLMKRPLDTIIDRQMGREVALRDGGVKAILAGRIERFGENFVLTALLIDPDDDAVVATLSEQSAGREMILAALGRQASRVRVALGERQERIKGTRGVEPATTRSLKAFRLYNDSYQLGRQQQWDAALAVARQVVVEDPEFASGWIWLSWMIHNAHGATPARRDGQSWAVVAKSEYRPHLERAMQLLEGLPQWERLWVAGSYHTLLGDHARAVPFYRALLELRPDHHYAANNLWTHLRRLNRRDDVLNALQILADQRPNDLSWNAAFARERVLRDRDTVVAQPYIDRVRRLIPEGKGQDRDHALSWVRWLPVYQLWDSGDIAGVLRHVRDADQPSKGNDGFEPIAIGHFHLALGRTHDAARILAGRGADLWVAIAREDRVAARTLIAKEPEYKHRPGTLMLAGRLDKVQSYVDDPPNDPDAETFVSIGRGELLLAANRPTAAIPHFQRGLSVLEWSRYSDYYIACESLATAFMRSLRRDEAVQALEECSRQRPRYSGPHFAGPFFWMSVRLRLADEYRLVGRRKDAEQIEAHLGSLLRYADDDVPLVKRLRARQAPGRPEGP